MQGRIPEDKIQEIRDRVDIVDVVSSYLTLKRSGANHQGLCPFHNEKTPSFNVNAPRQIFHCFGCGVGGNVFGFLMRMEGLSFPEAVRRLGERAGVEIETEELSAAEMARREERERLYRVSEVACAFYHQVLLDAPEAAPARRYLRERGYSGEAARAFRLGFAPPQWEALARHLEQKGFDPELARTLGLIRPGKQDRGDYDLFRNRLLFPILDSRGKVVAFGGRVLDDSLPKYINSSESPIYHKGRTLYGLYQAKEAMRQTGEVIVVEGYFDQLALHRAGVINTLATCGTALTEDHARLLKRYAKRAQLLFDQDPAGQKATFRALEVLAAEGVPATVVALDAGEDPDSFVQRHGAEAFGERLRQARPAIEVFMDVTLGEQGSSIDGQARAVEEILGLLQRLPNEIERDLYLKSLAKKTGLQEDLLRSKASRVERPAPAAPRPVAPRPAPVPAPRPPRPRRDEPTQGEKAQQWLLVMMLRDGKVRQRVAAEGLDQLFCDAEYLAVAERILQLQGDAEALQQALIGEDLHDEQKGILSGILIKDGEAFAEDTEGIFEGCHRATERDRLQRRLKQLRELMRQAEQAGELEQCTAFLRELSEIKKRL